MERKQQTTVLDEIDEEIEDLRREGERRPVAKKPLLGRIEAERYARPRLACRGGKAPISHSIAGQPNVVARQLG